jgi:uncharacterized protein YjbJ (UPF0337 family)
MCVDALILFIFKRIVSVKQWNTTHSTLWLCSNVGIITPLQGNLMNKDQIKGRVNEAKGKVKEVAGRIVDDNGLELEGNVQKNVGNVQVAVGDLKEELKKDH